MLKLDTEAIAKFLNILKLPIDYVWVIWIFTLFLIISPVYWKQYLLINELFYQYRPYVSIGFICSTTFILVYYAKKLKNGINYIFYRKRIVMKIKNLNSSEKSVIREFYLQDKDDILAPIDNDVLVTLQKDSIVYRTSTIGEQGLSGFLFPVSLTQIAKKFITKKSVDFPEVINEDNKKWLESNRPEFIGDINYRKGLFGH